MRDWDTPQRGVFRFFFLLKVWAAKLQTSQSGYFSALVEMLEKNYTGAAIEAWSATAGIAVGAEYGSLYGIGWAIGWEGGRYMTNNSEAYNRLAFGIYSDIYIKRALVYKWNVELDATQLHIAIHNSRN